MSASGPHLLIAKLSALEICGLSERHFDREVDTFVTVSVDGEQQLETEVIPNCVNPKWSFREPRNLMVHASSTITFLLYRRRRSRNVFGDKFLGQLEDKLHNFLTSPEKKFPLLNKMNWARWENASLSVVLDVDYSADADDVLDHAEEKLHSAIYRTVRGPSGPMAEALSALGESIESLDQLVNFVEGVVDIHPMCKAAWTLLSSVYKGFRSQRAQDASIRELAVELKETLVHARRCKNVHTVPGATHVIQDLARLVAECASVMDESMKYTMILRTAKSVASKTLHIRTSDCSRNLKKLRKKLEIVLLTAIHNDVADIKQDIKNMRDGAFITAAPSAPTPPPSEPYCSIHCSIHALSSPQPKPLVLPYALSALPTAPPTLSTSPPPAPHKNEDRQASPSMPSPSSSLSSAASFSFSSHEGPTPASSQSSLGALPDADEPASKHGGGRVLPDAPFVAEPEGMCCAHGRSSRASSGCRQGEAQRAAFQMLWG